MTNEDALIRAFKALIPESLDDIIRLRRDEAQLYLATGEEVMALYLPIRPAAPAETLHDWRFITLYVLPRQQGQMYLLGDKASNGQARITSVVRQIDLDRGLVITNSGTLYRLGKAGMGEPPLIHLLLICTSFHAWGFGMLLGVPPFFDEG